MKDKPRIFPSLRFKNILPLVLAVVGAFFSKGVSAEENTAVSQWLYASYSFGAERTEDTVIGGMKLYGAEGLIISTEKYENCLYEAETAVNDASFTRVYRGDRPCAAAVKHYCPMRSEGKRVVEGYLYFDAGSCFGTEDRELTFEVVYFDNRTSPIKLRYVNSENGFGVVDILCEGAQAWKTIKINVTDAYFNMRGSTKLGDGSCDFRIEANGAEAVIGRVALYDSSDSYSGRSYKSVTVNGRKTDRVYFTQSMWTPDSRRLLLRAADGWLYAYDVASDSVEKIVKSGCDFYVSQGNFLYYINTAAKTINRINLDGYEEEVLTRYPPGASGNPTYIHVNNSDTLLSVLYTENSSALDREVGEDGGLVTRCRRIPVYDIEKGEWDLRYTHEFPSGTPHMTHLMINPVYDKLVFFCHEGTTTKIPDRMWTIDRETGKKKNIFIQQDNSLGADNAVKTGETSGHENWTPDGEHMVFVKYPYGTNVGMNGIVRIDKYGEKREYINNDYKYWHCHPSSDNRFVTADTMIYNSSPGEYISMNVGTSEIVLIDIKTSESYMLAQIKAGTVHPYQPHPSFSPNGKLVSFARIDENDLLCVGIMDITDITADKPGEIFAGNTNADKGALLSEVSVSGDKASVTVRAEDGDAKISFYRADYNDSGALIGADIAQTDIADGEKKVLTVGGVSEFSRFFVWKDDNVPLSFEPTAPQALRAADISDRELRLYWQPPANLLADGIKYEVYRNGELIAEVSDSYFHDISVQADTKYKYSVRAIYPEGTVTALSQVEAETKPDMISAVLSREQYERGALSFLDNSYNETADSYTEKVFINGRWCRKSTEKVVAGRTKTGKFYFAAKDIPPDVRDIEFTAEYLDAGNAPIYIEYNAADGSVAKRVLLAKRGNTGEWVSASVSVNDAMFVKSVPLSNSDFRVEGGADTYLYSAGVRNISERRKTVLQSAFCNLSDKSDSSGLILVSTQTGDSSFEPAERSGKSCVYSPPGKNLYFDVSEDFAYGAFPRGIIISVEYFDAGNSPIYIEYNTNDPTYEGNTAYKKKQIAVGTNSGEWKTAKILLIDTCFRNAQDTPYLTDFRLNSPAGLTASFVKVSADVRQ